ncbi:MAG TPA: DUF2786 domain-containing protein [Acidimicrobiales bacterium]|nr:DUF2786 domain-containing protein [Acidimicrobiales bacterium]
MSTTASDTVLRRIRALLDQAERTPFPSEAETFAAKAAELMARHRVDEAAVSGPRPEDRRIVEADVELGRGQYVRARLALLGVVADALDCRLLTSVRADGRRGHLVGHASDVERVELLYTSLLVQATRAAAAEAVPRGHTGVEFRRSFLFGFAHRVGERLTEHMASAVRDAPEPAAGTSSVALVLADRRAAADDFIASRYGRVGRLDPAAALSATAADRGRVAGERADLHTGRGVPSGPHGALGS